MQALGVTAVNRVLYWNGREMTDEVIREFISAPETQTAYPFLAIAQEAGLEQSNYRYGTSVDSSDFDITVTYRDAHNVICVEYLMYTPEHFTLFAGGQYIYSGSDVNRVPFLIPYLVYIIAANKRHKEQIARIEELEAENAALRAEITERRLRPGGEDYEIARERFETQAYE